MNLYVIYHTQQGPKYRVVTEHPTYWEVEDPNDASGSRFRLPKSEYRIAQWADVSLLVHVEGGGVTLTYDGRPVASIDMGLRFVKVCDCEAMPPVAFIIEQNQR